MDGSSMMKTDEHNYQMVPSFCSNLGTVKSKLAFVRMTELILIGVSTALVDKHTHSISCTIALSFAGLAHPCRPNIYPTPMNMTGKFLTKN